MYVDVCLKVSFTTHKRIFICICCCFYCHFCACCLLLLSLLNSFVVTVLYLFYSTTYRYICMYVCMLVCKFCFKFLFWQFFSESFIVVAAATAVDVCRFCSFKLVLMCCCCCLYYYFCDFCCFSDCVRFVVAVILGCFPYTCSGLHAFFKYNECGVRERTRNI